MKIDIKKAFDSVPHCVIHRKLRELHVQDNMIKYIMNFVQLRYSALNGQNSCGIAQGDPLSMWLFCISINDVLKELDREDIKFIAYADDLVIQLENPEDAEDMVNHCASLFEKIGLRLNLDKCESTANRNEISFMGIQFGEHTRNLPISVRLRESCKEAVKEYE